MEKQWVLCILGIRRGFSSLKGGLLTQLEQWNPGRLRGVSDIEETTLGMNQMIDAKYTEQ
jgi:hypothetical protein